MTLAEEIYARLVTKSMGERIMRATPRGGPVSHSWEEQCARDALRAAKIFYAIMEESE